MIDSKSSKLAPFLANWKNEIAYRIKYDKTLSAKEKELLNSVLDNLAQIDKICEERGRY